MLTLSSGVGQTDAEQWSVAKLRRSGTDMKNSASLYLLHFTQGPFYIFSLMATVFFPIAIGKLAIALVQGYLACLNLGTVDVTERAAEREAKKKAK